MMLFPFPRCLLAIGPRSESRLRCSVFPVLRSFTLCVFFACMLSTSATAVPIEKDVTIEGDYIKSHYTRDNAGALLDLTLLSSTHNVAAGDGLMQEGFGVPSAYVPNRRVNETFSIVDSISDRPVLEYVYDCQGPNITGLHVTRTIEPMVHESSIRVKWKLEHKGAEQLWISPWVRNETAPGGAFEARDRIDIPTLHGIIQALNTSYHAAARNWASATDPETKETIYGVFSADQTHSFLAIQDLEQKACGFQTAFTPSVFKPGDAWETTYRLNVIKGLTHINFATDELAAQLDYKDGLLELRLASVKPLPTMQIEARVTQGDAVWKLGAKKFQLNATQVIRCSYDWKAPKEGSYEFIAKVMVGGKPYLLGQDTGSPHGGIDAQFAVGAPKNVSFEAWTDAPYALERGQRTLTRDLAVAGDVAMWFEPSLEKVFREDQVRPSGQLHPSAKVRLAQNEYESFQLVLRPSSGKRLKNVSIAVSDLTHKKSGAVIDSENIRKNHVGYYPVETPTYFEGPTGKWPDVLLPFGSFTAEPERCYPVWLTIHAPPKTEPGEYEGQITISADNREPVSLRIDVTVYNFELPKTPSLKTAFGYWPEEAHRTNKAFGCSTSEEELDAAYLENAREHRVTLRELAEFPSPSPDYAQQLQAFEPKLRKLMEGGATTVSVPVSLLDSPDQLKAVDAFIAEKKLSDRVYCLMSDEPPPPTWERVYKNVEQWRQTAPHIPTMVTTFGVQPFLSDALDIWTVHLQMLDTLNNNPILSRMKEGREVWWYVDAVPPRPYGNFFIDFAGIEHRILFWHTWALGMRGFYYWGVNAAEPGENPYTDQLDLTPANGDGFLVYPSKNGPLSSIRWEIIRDGIEDFDYLVLLGKRIQAARDAGVADATLAKAEQARNLESVIPNLVTFTRDVIVLQKKRDEIGAMIEALATLTK